MARSSYIYMVTVGWNHWLFTVKREALNFIRQQPCDARISMSRYADGAGGHLMNYTRSEIGR